jgi:hypothetical protein
MSMFLPSGEGSTATCSAWRWRTPITFGAALGRMLGGRALGGLALGGRTLGGLGLGGWCPRTGGGGGIRGGSIRGKPSGIV